LLLAIGEIERRHKHPEEGPIPTLDDIMELSKDPDTYKWMCLKLLPFVVGHKIWIKQCYKSTISAIATCSDETFVLLTLENNYDRWQDEANWIVNNKHKDVKDQAKKVFATSKYTNSGTKKNGKSRPFQGWSQIGYRRFNSIYNEVSNDRKRRGQFEQELLASLQSNVNTENEESDSEAEEEEIYPANDFAGVPVPLRGARSLGNQLPESDNEGESQDEEDDPYFETPQA
jgi:hypothetical protein